MLRHAFIMSVHTNMEQLQVLVTALHFGDVYIHVDKKQEALYQNLKETYKNIVILSIFRFIDISTSWFLIE